MLAGKYDHVWTEEKLVNVAVRQGMAENCFYFDLNLFDLELEIILKCFNFGNLSFVGLNTLYSRNFNLTFIHLLII